MANKNGWPCEVGQELFYWGEGQGNKGYFYGSTYDATGRTAFTVFDGKNKILGIFYPEQYNRTIFPTQEQLELLVAMNAVKNSGLTPPLFSDLLQAELDIDSDL